MFDGISVLRSVKFLNATDSYQDWIELIKKKKKKANDWNLKVWWFFIYSYLLEIVNNGIFNFIGVILYL